jgi:predicted transposase YdaD
LTNTFNSAERRGIKKEALRIARNLKGMNMPLADISKATGLSIEEINAID